MEQEVNEIVAIVAEQNAITLAKAAALLVIGIIAIKLILRVFDRVIKNLSMLTESIRRLLRSVLKWILSFVCALSVANILGIPVTSFVALFSLVGLAISLALQGFLSNMAGSLTILISKPFALGDFIETDTMTGTVQEIGMMYTKLLSPDGRVLHIPNSSMYTSRIINYSTNGKRRIDLTVSASYNNSPDEVRRAIQDALATVGKREDCSILETPEAQIVLEEYGDSDISYVLRVWTLSSKLLTTKYALNEELYYAFERNKVEMSYPHMNVHVN